MANKAAEEAMLKARDTGVGPVFTEGQLLTLSTYCKQRGIDPTEFIAAYTDYVISEFSAKSTAAEMVTHVELAVAQVPDPKVVIELYRKKTKGGLRVKIQKTNWREDFGPCRLSRREQEVPMSGMKANLKCFRPVLIRLGSCIPLS